MALDALPDIVADASVVVNAAQTESGNKTLFDAMASARSLLPPNPAFSTARGVLPLDFMSPEGDRDALTDRLAIISRMSALERERLGGPLRRWLGHGIRCTPAPRP